MPSSRPWPPPGFCGWASACACPAGHSPRAAGRAGPALSRARTLDPRSRRYAGRHPRPRPFRPQGAAAGLAGRPVRHASGGGRVPAQPGFAGYSAFDPNADYGADFASYLIAPGARHLVMCHPGEVDDELRTLDPATASRLTELAFFRSSRFTDITAAVGLVPGRMTDR